jgi:ABC-2 type transport system ATP-binding protein
MSQSPSGPPVAPTPSAVPPTPALPDVPPASPDVPSPDVPPNQGVPSPQASNAIESVPVAQQSQQGWLDRVLRRRRDVGVRWAIGLDHVSRRFGDVVALDDVSFAVPEGGIVGVIGPSGAGKTTAIRLMTGAIAPDSGVVRVLDEDPRRFRRRTRERIGYMPQLFVLYPDLTASENVQFMAALFGIPPWRRGTRVEKVLELVNLTDARDRRASALSGGMQRRLELACALVHQPSLLVLDEPTAGIDPLLRTRIWQELDRLRTAGVTIIVTTQYVSEAEYCDSVALISEGDLVAFAPPDELRRQALGGEMLSVGTGAPFDARTLPPIEGVVSVSQNALNELLFVTENAGLATPRINDAIEAAGGHLEYSREHRPTFDEVFATLVTQHLATRQAAAEAAAQAQNLQAHSQPQVPQP